MPELTWRFLELEAADHWRLTPDQFDEKSDREKAEMMAYLWVSRKVEAYHMEMTEKTASAKAEKR